MADATLTAERRDTTGKKRAAGRVRREGLVPGVVYGLGEENVSITVSQRELAHILSGGANTLITLKVDGGNQLTLARQIQRHPIKGTYVHVDFIRVRADQTIQADVQVHLIGESEGATRGGVLEQMLHTVSVEARPADIPHELEIDITALQIGDSLRVRDLTVPAGVLILIDADEPVVQVSQPRVVEEVAAPAEGEVVEGEAVEGEAGAAPAAGGEQSSSEG